MPQFDDHFLMLSPGRRRRCYRPHADVLVTLDEETPTLIGVHPLDEDTPSDGETDQESESSVTPTKPRGGKLARRARSFKEDFLEILSAMRSPSGGGGVRSGSPLSPKSRGGKGSSDVVDTAGEKNPLRDLDTHVRQVQFALKHFRDVISKNKLEMLPGNGTVVLETVSMIHSVLKTYVLNEQSSTLVSATNQVYQSLAKLIKLCDDVMLYGDKILSGETTSAMEVVELVEEAVQNLVSLAQDKITNRELNCKTLGMNYHSNHHHGPNADRTSSYSMAGSDLPQRASLPDIPLTPRERQILEQTASVLDRHTGLGRRVVMDRNMHKSQSEESILVDNSPPPKPPLPGSRAYHLSESSSPSSDPPPLPPKRRNKNMEQLVAPDFDSSSLTDTLNSSSNSGGCGRSSLISGLAASFDRISMRSKSPEDTSSLLSASAGSLDSVLNHSREEEEIQVLMDPIEDTILSSENILAQGGPVAVNGGSCCCWESSSTEPGHSVVDAGTALMPLPNHLSDLSGIAPGSMIGVDNLGADVPAAKLERLPSQTESGFASMHSLRSSSQSYTTSSVSSQQFSSSVSRSSQQSSISFSSSESTASKTLYQKSSSTTTESNFSSMTQKIVSSSDLVADSISSSVFSQCTQSKASTFITTEEIISPKSSPTKDPNGSPPALPQKTRSKRRKDRQVSQYDNLPSGDASNHIEQHLVSCSMHQSQSSIQMSRSPIHQSQAVAQSSPDNKPPPLPLKKKHIMAYMEMFGNCSHQNNNEFLRHSMHTYNMLQAEWQQQEMSLTSTQSCSFSMVSSRSSQVLPAGANNPVLEGADRPASPPKEVSNSTVPPALPPKRGRTSSVRSTSSPPPLSPPCTAKHQEAAATKENHIHDADSVTVREESTKPVLRRLELKSSPAATNIRDSKRVDGNTMEVNPLEELDIMSYLVIKKPEEEGLDVRGGHPDALVVHATKANKNDFMYQEAFLTTYRTFLSPLELIQKLCQRHDRFSCSSDPVKQRAAREAFSLLVRVVSDLTMSDLTDEVLQMLMKFVYQLLCSGDLIMAKALRVKILEKCTAKRLYNSSSTLLSSLNVYTRQPSLLDFKSEQIAEQMTLLDSNLFMKIEIPEVLIWAQEQNEERSPNLTHFTEHFNKMSYWARSRILEQTEAKDRERYVVKFIKIMKHLRKINNFNSYLALLSALDSAPIRRLEWQKHITEGLKEYCALIDSSSSFRAYRQALAETQAPCIPYIGLVLQDLTFVHIGNSDLLMDGSINFSKRWQQFNIVENMKRFKKENYLFKKHERIIAFFNNFDDFLCEEAMWQISESIKPRGGKKTQT